MCLCASGFLCERDCCVCVRLSGFLCERDCCVCARLGSCVRGTVVSVCVCLGSCVFCLNDRLSSIILSVCEFPGEFPD